MATKKQSGNSRNAPSEKSIARTDSGAGGWLDADASLENEPGVLFDAIAIAGGDAAAATLAADVRALEHVRDAYRHGKPLLFVGSAHAVLDAAIDGNAQPADAGLLVVGSINDKGLKAFADAIAGPRFADRELALVTP